LHPQNLKGETKMKRLVIAVALGCSLSGTALAGEIPSTDFAPPPPQSAALAGIVPTSDSASPGEVPTSDLEVLLAILDLAF
jgi:hypothetical protein